jgi:predicted PurR-regulated permease PerM
MNLSIDSQKRLGSFLLVVAMGILAFFVVRPILFAVIGGLLLAYIFYPLYIRLLRFIKNDTVCSAITLLIAVALIAIPIWFAVPIMFKQLFQIYISSQNIDTSSIIQYILPTASPDFVIQATLTLNAAISKAASSILSTLALDYTNISSIFTFFLHLIVIGIIFFFALRDNVSFKNFVDAISPLSKVRERIVVKQFKDITNAILFGYVVVGVLQGIFAGLGLFLFGIPNALALTFVAIVLCILPFIGTPFIWIPATIYLFAMGRTGAAVAFLLYNLIFVSTIDNIIRAYIVSKKSKVSQVVILLGMIGGILLFGALGLVLGPLILAYFLTFLNMHKRGKFVVVSKE